MAAHAAEPDAADDAPAALPYVPDGVLLCILAKLDGEPARACAAAHGWANAAAVICVTARGSHMHVRSP
jgi:hypothetical protein